MKFNKILIAVSILLLSAVYSCSPKVYPSSAVNYDGGTNEADGTITLNAGGSGANEEKAVAAAAKNAFTALFFRGIPGSKQNTPLIGTDEDGIIQKNQRYFDSFYGDMRYRSFITNLSSGPVASVGGGDKGVTAHLTINLTALRSDLEQFNIIRKFGY